MELSQHHNLPAVAAPSLDGLTAWVEAPPPLTGEDLIHRLHEVLRFGAERRELRPGETLELGDEVDCDIVATVDGHLVPSALQRLTGLELRGLPAAPGLIELLVGMAADSSRTAQLTMPPDYSDAKLAGKVATIHLTTRAARRVSMPELDDAGALSRAGLGNTVEEAMTVLSRQLQQERDQELLVDATEAVLDVLAERVRVDIPAEAIDLELAASWQNGPGATLSETSFSAEAVEQARRDFLREPALRTEAERKLRIGLALAAIIREEQLEPAPHLAETLIQATAESTGTDLQEARAALAADRESAGKLMATTLHMTAVQHVMARAKVEVVNPTPAR